MNKKEIDRLKLVSRKILEISDVLSDNNYTYDFKNIDLDSGFMEYILSDNYILELQKIKEEKDKQTTILENAKNKIRLKYQDCHIIDQISYISNYNNYYIVTIYGIPFGKITLIYSKKGNLWEFILQDVGVIVGVDENNFLVLNRGKRNTINVIHNRINGISYHRVNKIENVYSSTNCLEDSYNNIKFDNFITWDIDIGYDYLEKRHTLYNYKDAEIKVPEYSFIKDDYGDFSGMIDRDDLLRVVSIYDYGQFKSELQYLIDRDGNLCTDVYDFSKGICYSRKDRGESQVDILNSICKEVMGNVVAEYNSYSKVKK